MRPPIGFKLSFQVLSDFSVSFVPDRNSQKNIVVGNICANKRPSIRVSSIWVYTNVCQGVCKVFVT